MQCERKTTQDKYANRFSHLQSKTVPVCKFPQKTLLHRDHPLTPSPILPASQVIEWDFISVFLRTANGPWKAPKLIPHNGEHNLLVHQNSDHHPCICSDKCGYYINILCWTYFATLCSSCLWHFLALLMHISPNSVTSCCWLKDMLTLAPPACRRSVQWDHTLLQDLLIYVFNHPFGFQPFSFCIFKDLVGNIWGMKILNPNKNMLLWQVTENELQTVSLFMQRLRFSYL